MEFDENYYEGNSQDRDRPALWFYQRIWKKYCGGKLVLDIEDAGPSWRITFTDFGVGISDENKDAIFRRFKQVSIEGAKGSGLGLAIVKKIIELT